ARFRPLLSGREVPGPQRFGHLPVADDLQRLAGPAREQPLRLAAQRAVREHPARPRLDALAENFARRVEEPDQGFVAGLGKAMLALQLTERSSRERVHFQGALDPDAVV